MGNACRAEGNLPAARAEFAKVIEMEGAKDETKKDARLAIEKIDGQLKTMVPAAGGPAKRE
jgi:hypothetical protein